MFDLKNLLEKTQKLMKKPTGEHVPVLGLDVSHHYVRFSQLEPRGDKWVLLSMISRALDPNIVDDAALEMELIKALLDARKEGRFTTDKVAVSLPITSAVVKVVWHSPKPVDTFHSAV
jgi:Tfp pilus assembly PilM family ATPase